MISKPKVRLIKSLQVKKYRLAEQCFLVQGAKAVTEVLASDYKVELLCATRQFLDNNKLASKAAETIEASEKELTAISSVESNNAALAVVRMKPPVSPNVPANEFTLALDDIRDPGNLGTILRVADWYGIRQVVASEETADLYNPKVINATMGSFLRVSFAYASLTEVLSTVSVPVFGTFLDGEDVHDVSFGRAGVIVIGNESRGISDGVARRVSKRISIPRYGKAESLNAAVASAIVLDNLRSR